MTELNARVILLAGPSGSGKSFVARQTGLPVLCLDHFYRDSDDPAFNHQGATIDWEAPTAWNAVAAVEAIERLCRDGAASTPIYALGADRRVGSHVFDLAGARLFVAEGIFAAEIVAECAARALLAGAYTLRRPRVVTYVRRLARDLTERRKPPAILVRRGIALLRAEPAVIERQTHLGARPASARHILTQVAKLHPLSQLRHPPREVPHTPA